MIRMRLSLALSFEVATPGSDFIFNLHAAHTPRQTVVDETLMVNQTVPRTVEADPMTGNRYLRLSAAAGSLEVWYTASVDLNHYMADPEHIDEIPVFHQMHQGFLGLGQLLLVGGFRHNSRHRSPPLE